MALFDPAPLTVPEAVSRLADLSTDELEDLRDVEMEGKNRITLIHAIDDELSDDLDADEEEEEEEEEAGEFTPTAPEEVPAPPPPAPEATPEPSPRRRLKKPEWLP